MKRMRSVPVHIAITSLLITTFAAVVYTDEIYYEFGTDCDKYIKYLDEYDKIYVEYTGNNITNNCETIKFQGKGYDLYDEYEVCFTLLSFIDSSCAATLIVQSYLDSQPDHKITCNSKQDEEHCGSQDRALSIELRPLSRQRSSAIFRFLITARKVYDDPFGSTSDTSTYSSNTGIFVVFICGLVIGALVLITAIIAVTCCCVYKRRPSQGRVFIPLQASVNYVQYSSQPQQNTAYGIPATGASPSVSQLPVLQQTTGATNPQPPSNELSTAPPSYEVVMKRESEV